jgi:acyl-CoA synthetase (AMP-forming)/AMP-acid ligase II
MKVPFNILDFLDRAEHVYGDLIGVVDEPDQPADSLGALTWRQVATHVRAMAAGLDALGVGRGERVAIVSPNSARLFIALFAVSGYWDQPAECDEALRSGWFHTGDGGTFEDGYVSIADRKKDVIITGGENVSSIEVEDCLCRHRAVAEAAVIAVPDERWGETVKAIVVLHPDVTATADDLIAHCRSRLAHFSARRPSSWCRRSPARRPARSRSSSSAKLPGAPSTEP